jgi:hypothetical protein
MTIIKRLEVLQREYNRAHLTLSAIITEEKAKIRPSSIRPKTIESILLELDELKYDMSKFIDNYAMLNKYRLGIGILWFKR